jgi:hypothetical protein
LVLMNIQQPIEALESFWLKSKLIPDLFSNGFSHKTKNVRQLMNSWLNKCTNCNICNRNRI